MRIHNGGGFRNLGLAASILLGTPASRWLWERPLVAYAGGTPTHPGGALQSSRLRYFKSSGESSTESPFSEDVVSLMTLGPNSGKQGNG